MKLSIAPYNVYFLIGFLLIIIDYLNYQQSDGWFIFDIFLRLGIWIVAVVLLLVGLFKLLRTEENVRLSTFKVVLPVIILTILLYSSLSGLFKDRLIFRAHYDGDINGLTVELYEGGAYQLHDMSIFGGDVKKGYYELKGDTIVLSNRFPLGEDRDLTNRLVINETVLLGLDQYDRESLEFKIIENRITEANTTPADNRAP